ncbi:TPA: SMI1/KNR4 family protein [Salmonella enterica]|nr:SMI1/KNR4 family protein [Salmonella enterica]
MLSKIKLLGGVVSPFQNNEKMIALNEIQTITGGIPDDYRDFLFYYGGAIKFNCMVIFKGIKPSGWADSIGFDTIDFFYGLIDSNKNYLLTNAISTYMDDFKTSWIPIGYSAGGNQICLCIKGSQKGTVWFWDHETDPIVNNKPSSGLTLISSGLNEFISILEKEEDDNCPSKAIGGFLDF